MSCAPRFARLRSGKQCAFCEALLCRAKPYSRISTAGQYLEHGVQAMIG